MQCCTKQNQKPHKNPAAVPNQPQKPVGKPKEDQKDEDKIKDGSDSEIRDEGEKDPQKWRRSIKEKKDKDDIKLDDITL